MGKIWVETKSKLISANVKFGTGLFAQEYYLNMKKKAKMDGAHAVNKWSAPLPKSVEQQGLWSKKCGTLNLINDEMFVNLNLSWINKI